MKKFAAIIIGLFIVVSVQAQTPLNWIDGTDIEPFQESTIVYEGNYSCGIIVNTGVQANCNFSNDVEIPVTAGESFKIAYWGYTSEFVRARVVFTWNGATTSYSTGYLGPNTGAWEEFVFEDVIPAGATGVNIGVRFYDVSGFAPGEIQYIDAFTFESPTGNQLVVTNGDFEEWSGVAPEPDNYPTNFAAEAVGLTAALSWVDATGGQLPTTYLIKASTSSDITLPEDGVYISDDLDLSDGIGAVNVDFGVGNFSFPNLESSTTYYFKIFPYTNSGANMDYKTDGTPPSAQAQTSDVVIINTENFDVSFGEWTPVSVIGDEVWDRDNTYGVNGTPCAQMTGYVSGTVYENEDWLISPGMDFNNFDNEILTFYSAVGYITPEPQFAVRISTDYDGGGDPTTANWTDLDPILPDGSVNWEWTYSGEVNISGYNSDNVYVAFIFFCGTDASGTWEVDEIVITGEGEYTPDPEPTNYPADFAANAQSQNISITWIDAVGDQLPAGYLILGSDDENFDSPVDGTPVAEDTDLSDGQGALNIPQGVQVTAFSNLPVNTTYYFKIFPYTNSGEFIDYKNDGTAPATSATTEENFFDNLLFTTFNEGWEEWTPISITGDQVWDRVNTYGIEETPCAKMTGYEGASFENEDWLISPEVNVGGTWIDEQLIFNSAVGYTGIPLEVKISTDYDGGGDPYSATWTDLSGQAIWPTGDPYFEWTNSGAIDISDWGQGTIHIAFVFYSTEEGSATWEVDNVTVQAIFYDNIGEPNNADVMNIYPNPGNGIFNIKSKNSLEAIEIYTLTGTLVHRQQISESNFQINLKNLDNGIYFVRGFEKGTGKIFNNRIIIQ